MPRPLHLLNRALREQRVINPSDDADSFFCVQELDWNTFGAVLKRHKQQDRVEDVEQRIRASTSYQASCYAVRVR